MAPREKKTIQGVALMLNSSAKAIPAPMELPAWKEEVMRKIPIPMRIAQSWPKRPRISSIREDSCLKPMRAESRVYDIIRNMAITITQIMEYPKLDPNFVFTVRLPGPKTKAAVMIPGPIDSKNFFKCKFFSTLPQDKK